MSTEENANLTRHATIQALKSQQNLQEGDWAETAGFHTPGDGGAALYHIQKSDEESPANNANVIDVGNGLVASLQETQAINYKMFGAISDGEQDDGVQIKQAHQYANEHRVPIVNLTGEYWIKQTNNIPIQTNVHWGQTTIHIDEKFNSKSRHRFVVRNDLPTQKLDLDENTKAALLEKIKPGVQLIPELAPYAGHLITVEDSEDRIGIRAGNYSKRGWAREELFYVEEEGRIIGDIAWAFKNFTEITATPCNDNYLIIEGGGFYFSGDIPGDKYVGYYAHGIQIQRSRTIVRQQWMGLEKGHRDISMQARRGFYSLSNVYDVTLEDIRAIPWEKNRTEKDRVVGAGTYGIGGARMLNCKFDNLTAEGGWVAWGVFGTNLNKNFTIENCRLNRIDVHFHCWNLRISNCIIGFKGISVTGGGDLLIENTVRHGNQLVNFRRDYGAKWDGNIDIRGCTLKPSSNGRVAVLSYQPSNFDYQYPIGFGRSINIQDLRIDYSAAPESTNVCRLMDIVPFSKTDNGTRLFFPNQITFRDISVQGRQKGVRLIRIPNPQHYEIAREGSYDGDQLTPNCTIICDNVDLENFTPRNPQDTRRAHLRIGDETTSEYSDAHALYPQIRFTECNNVSLVLNHAIASALFDRCKINTINATDLQGELIFDTCRLQPNVEEASGNFYAINSTLGTRFTNCTLHAPVVNGQADPEQVNNTGVLEINKSVHYHHLNTALSNDVVNHFKTLSPEFISKLKSHHQLET